MDSICATAHIVMTTNSSHQRPPWQQSIFLILFLQLQLIIITVLGGSSNSDEQDNQYIHYKVHMPIEVISGHHHIVTANRLHQPKELKIVHNPMRYHHLLHQHSQHPSLPRALPPKKLQESHSNRFLTPLSTLTSSSSSSSSLTNFGGHHPKVDPFLPVLPYQLISSHASVRPKSLPFLKTRHFPLKSPKNKEMLLALANGKNKLLSSSPMLSPIVAATSATISHDMLQELVMLPQNTTTTAKDIPTPSKVFQPLTSKSIHTSPLQYVTSWNSNRLSNNYSTAAPLATPSSYIAESRHKQKEFGDRTKDASVVYKATIINSTVNSDRIATTTLTPRLTTSTLSSLANLPNNSKENRNSKQHLIVSSENPHIHMAASTMGKQQLLLHEYVRQQPQLMVESGQVSNPIALPLLQSEEMRGTDGMALAARTNDDKNNDNTSGAIMTMIGNSNRRPNNKYGKNKQYFHSAMASSKSLGEMARRPSRTNTLSTTTTMATLGDIWSLPLKPTAQSLLMTNKFPQRWITTIGNSNSSSRINRTTTTRPTYNNHKNLLAFRPQVNLEEGQTVSMTSAGLQSKPIASTLHQNINDASKNNRGTSKYQFVSAAQFENVLDENGEEGDQKKTATDLPQSLQNYIYNLYRHPEHSVNGSGAQKEPLIKWSPTKQFADHPFYQSVNNSSINRWPPSMVALQNEVLPYTEYSNGYVLIPALFDESMDFNQSNSKTMTGSEANGKKDKVEPLSYHWHQQHYVPHTVEMTSYTEKTTPAKQIDQNNDDIADEKNNSESDEIIEEAVNADQDNYDSLSDETVP